MRKIKARLVRVANCPPRVATDLTSIVRPKEDARTLGDYYSGKDRLMAARWSELTRLYRRVIMRKGCVVDGCGCGCGCAVERINAAVLEVYHEEGMRR